MSFTYCNCTWSSTYVSNLKRILYLQKRAVRAITNSDYRAHSAPLFTKLGILDIFQGNTFQVAKFMFYYHIQLLPSMFLNLFVTSGQVHNYGTRTVNSYRSHSCHTNLKQFTILYQGPKIWNSLPATLTYSPSLPSFEKKILGFLIKSDLVQSRTHAALIFIDLFSYEVASIISLVVS